ncbi:sigma-70 family RNA polymerase sigma factor [Roseovarius sp. MMSF_3281]|uniref:sigma-70 family RNA polymerase sigma factor n=1 Tax=Roseovarius sp. MMSF_3281 TaxID=3046694 RepID=UPI00273D9C52|nr:sigma-70 family RNA polymerase sigma factor [Roseovarius sp. MMSF_3281]
MATRDEIETLLAACTLGDKRAFGALYSATSAKLFGICLRVLDNRAEAEEVLHDVYVKIWHNAGRYQANGLSPMTWLITIARNAAVDRLRKRRAPAVSMEQAEARPDPGPGPEAQAVAASEAERLSACFDELDEGHAQAVRGAYLDGETYADLAARFEVPLNTMRTWLRRSLLKLKECLSR